MLLQNFLAHAPPNLEGISIGNRWYHTVTGKLLPARLPSAAADGCYATSDLAHAMCSSKIKAATHRAGLARTVRHLADAAFVELLDLGLD